MKLTDYNTTNDSREEIVRKKLSELEERKTYPLVYIGTYVSSQYGKSAYFDIRDNGQRVRVSFPKRMYDTIVKVVLDENLMNEVKAEKYGIKVHSFTTKNGFTAYDVHFVEL